MKQIALAIHGAMLADDARNQALAAGIAALVKPGDIVVDVGAGSGLLSMLAVRAGAQRVYALENSTMALLARRLIDLNHMSASIELVHTYSHAWQPPARADVILCETLGFAALDEGFRASLVDARERMLRPGGLLLPGVVRILAVPVQAEASQPDITELDTLLGLDYQPLGAVMRRVFQRRYIAYADELAQPQTLFTLDCYTMRADHRLTAQVVFELATSGTLAGFALWFEAELAPGVHMANRCPDPHNHWGQTYLPLGRALPVTPGQQVTLTIEMNDKEGSLSISWESEVAPTRGSSQEYPENSVRQLP